MIISPQLGHGNFVASVLGAMIRWHEVHVGTLIVVVFSVTLIPRRRFGMGVLLYMCCVLMLCVSFLSPDPLYYFF